MNAHEKAQQQIEKARRMSQMAADQNGLKSHWSVAGVTDFLSVHRFRKAKKLIYDTSSGFLLGGMKRDENDIEGCLCRHDGRALESHVIEAVRSLVSQGRIIEIPIDGPRWLDLYIAADKAIAESGDDHHRFIEDFRVGTDRSTVILSTGS